MRHFFRYFSWKLAIIALLAIVLLFLFEFLFFENPEFFNGANKIGKIIYGLLLSYLAAYVFYILTVYYKEYRMRKSVRIPLQYEVEQILKSYHSLFLSISKSSGINIEDCFSREDIETACSKLKTTESPLNPYEGNTVKLPNNWITYLNVNKDVSIERISSIFSVYLNNMDYVLIDLLVKIKTSEYFELVNIADQRKVEYEDFSQFFPAMSEYIILMKSLHSYSNKSL